MRTRGSITVFLALTIPVILSLYFAVIFSVSVQCGRAIAAEALEEAVFSLFSEYDRDLLADFDLFFLDAGGADSLILERYLSFTEEAASYILDPEKGQTIPLGRQAVPVSVREKAVTGYVTAGTSSGAPCALQAIAYVKTTFGADAIASLLSGTSDANTAEQQMAEGEQALSEDADTAMSEVEQAAKEKKEAEEAAKQDGGASDTAPTSAPAPPAVSDADKKEAENIMDAIRSMEKCSLLDLVTDGKVSEKSIKKEDLPSARTPEPSMGTVDLPSVSTQDRLLFREYLFTHFGDYLSPGNAGLSYQMEYFLAGKTSDRANLNDVMRRLLLVRTGANLACLLADSSLRSQAEALAVTIASALAVPEFSSVVEGILLAGWSFAESIADLRTLFHGRKTALVKTSANWQVSLENIPSLLTDPDALCKGSDTGLSYEDYLRIFLLSPKWETLTGRFLDMIENTVRTAHDRPSFRIDRCIDTMTVEMTFSVKNRYPYTITAARSYRAHT